MMRGFALAVILALTSFGSTAMAQPIGVALASNNDRIYVDGRAVHFEQLGTVARDPVVRTGDAGLATMLSLVGARMQFEPGTRFVVLTRADGKLVTFTVGSNAVTIDDTSTGIPFGPFYDGDHLYVPLLALAQAIGLNVRSFSGGYAFSPQIISVSRRVGQRRTILEIQATAPLEWRAAYGGQPHKPMLVITFPGFANAAGEMVALGGREAKNAAIAQAGPPGFPITSVTLDAARGVKFAAHRVSPVGLDIVLARATKDLALRSIRETAPSVARTNLPASSSATAQPTAASSPSPSAKPLATTSGYSAGTNPVATAVPAPEVTDNSTANPAETPVAGASESPTPLPSGASPSPSGQPIQKITEASVTDAQGVSRLSLTISGPVSFEWHRLADPDNRVWVDIYQAELIGPATDLTVKLPVVKSVKISQHELSPDHVVRISIEPTQPVDIAIGSIEGAPNQLGIDIRSTAPPAGAPSNGVGAFLGPQPTPWKFGLVSPAPMDPRLVVIDPGHGGNDPGAMNQYIGLRESNLTLQIAKLLKADLEHAGWRVSLTRDGDYEVGDPSGDDKQELQARCDIANAAGARLFISVHINSSVSSEPSGITTYYWRQADRQLAQAVQAGMVQATNAGDAGVKRDNFYVIHHTIMTAVLVEAAYLSNPHDAQLLTQPRFLDRVASGIAQGVKDFTGGPPAP